MPSDDILCFEFKPDHVLVAKFACETVFQLVSHMCPLSPDWIKREPKVGFLPNDDTAPKPQAREDALRELVQKVRLARVFCWAPKEPIQETIQFVAQLQAVKKHLEDCADKQSMYHWIAIRRHAQALATACGLYAELGMWEFRRAIVGNLVRFSAENSCYSRDDLEYEAYRVVSEATGLGWHATYSIGHDKVGEVYRVAYDLSNMLYAQRNPWLPLQTSKAGIPKCWRQGDVSHSTVEQF